ncbi:MAG: glycosyltransferase [Anaerolineaceae bacterium]|nr:glycosyltransferase [Anaerolineaceae bacterium]
MRILMVSDFYAPFIGGAEYEIQLLATELTRRQHTVSVATVWHTGLAAQEDQEGVKVYRLRGLSTRVPWFSQNPGRRFHPPFPDPSMVWGLRRLIDHCQPDVVNAQGWSVYSAAAALLGKRIPLVVSARDYGFSCALRTLMNKGTICTGPGPLKCVDCARQPYGFPKAVAATAGIFLFHSLILSRIQAVHSVSRFVESVIKRDLLGTRPGRTITRTISDIPLRHSGTVSLENGDYPLPDEPFILFVGALQTNKGIHVLLEAYHQLESPPPLVLIGTVWPDTPETFPSGVTVLYNLPHAVVMAAWERALFGIVPSIWPDPLPGVVREAMSKRKAVIGTAVGGISDMITDGENGLLVPPGDADALAAAMNRLIQTPDLREQLGEAAQRSIQMLIPDTIIPQFESLYQEAIDQCKHG